MVQLQGSVVLRMLLNEAVSKRIVELLKERDMTNYQLYIKSGVPKSTIGNLVNCTYDSVKLRVIHEVCQGFGISITEFLTPRCSLKTIWNPKSFCANGTEAFLLFGIDKCR